MHTSRSNGRDERYHRPSLRLTGIAEMTDFGAVKWFDEKKRYGFIVPDKGGQDIFLHQSTAQLYGVRPSLLLKGVRVAFNFETVAGRGPLATAIAIA
jgi:cold shock CspA family protein